MDGSELKVNVGVKVYRGSCYKSLYIALLHGWLCGVLKVDVYMTCVDVLVVIKMLINPRITYGQISLVST